MFNKKFKIIILAVIIFFLSAASIFALKIKSKNTENKTTGDETSTSILEELKNNHPEFSVTQLEFYSETAKKSNMVPCIGRSDANDCISAVAFIKRAYNFCGEIKDEKIKTECSNAILLKKAAAEIDKCYSSGTDDLKTPCLINIFQMYKQPEDCSGLKVQTVIEKCEAVVYYQKALAQGDKKLCDKIKDEYLKSYCVK